MFSSVLPRMVKAGGAERALRSIQCRRRYGMAPQQKRSFSFTHPLSLTELFAMSKTTRSRLSKLPQKYVLGFAVVAIQPAGIFEHCACALALEREFSTVDEHDVGGQFERLAQLMRGHHHGLSSS